MITDVCTDIQSGRLLKYARSSRLCPGKQSLQLCELVHAIELNRLADVLEGENRHLPAAGAEMLARTRLEVTHGRLPPQRPQPTKATMLYGK